MKCRKSVRVFGLLSLMVALMCVAWNRQEYTVYQLRVNNIRGSKNGDTITMTDPTSFTLDATIDGKYAITGGDATTGLMLQKANVTAGTNATETITFTVVFGAAPTVTLTYTEDPGDVRPAFVTSVTATNFLANITADKNYGYIAVGTRP